MKKDLAAEYREAIDEFCNLLMGLRALNSSHDPDFSSRMEAAKRRCEVARAALFGAGGAGVTL
jgi:hypothetical protein